MAKFVSLDKLSAFKTKLMESINLSAFIRASDVGTAVDPNPINADRLGGKTASDFALKTDLDPLASKADLGSLASKTDLDSLATKAEVAKKAPSTSPTFNGTPKVSANANYAVAQIRNVIISTGDPTSSDGNNGDIYIKYKA